MPSLTMEHSGNRRTDLAWSGWHRDKLPTWCGMTDADDIEVRYGDARALIETKDDRASPMQEWQKKIYCQLANGVGKPAFQVRFDSSSFRMFKVMPLNDHARIFLAKIGADTTSDGTVYWSEQDQIDFMLRL